MLPLVRDLHAIFEAAIRSVQPRGLLESFDWDRAAGRPLVSFNRVCVAGTGKASMAMAGALEEELDSRLDEGFVTVPHNYTSTFPEDLRRPEKLEIVESGHPMPDAASVRASERALEMAKGCGPDDLLIVPISGGGSALWTALWEGISLPDGQDVARLLLRSGANIHEINTVRKHLSRIKGGRLAQAAHPATVLALLISDVVGDNVDVIASGPTVPDPSTFTDAVSICRRYGIWMDLPGSVRSHLEAGLGNPALETPAPGAPLFERIHTLLLGTNRDALKAAKAKAGLLGYHVRIETDRQTGEARDVARLQVKKVLAENPEKPTCLLWGGETTVTVTGDGKGGRNQEVCLSAAIALDGVSTDVAYLSGGTDGIDGPTDAAGAWVEPNTVEKARSCGLEPQTYLDRNDAYTFFDQIGQLLLPGSTHTNVMDIQVALVRPTIQQN